MTECETGNTLPAFSGRVFVFILINRYSVREVPSVFYLRGDYSRVPGVMAKTMGPRQFTHSKLTVV
jgi:hypothetical protein